MLLQGMNNFMSTLTERVNKAIRDGYTDNMRVTRQGLYSCAHNKTYLPSEVQIVDFCRFEGESDPADNAILYVIETNDGDKGTLIDAFGPYADEIVSRFISNVKLIRKKIFKNK